LILSELALVEARAGDPEGFAHFEEAFAGADTQEEMAEAAVRYAMLLALRGRLADAEVLIDRVITAIRDRERQLLLEAELSTLALNYEFPALASGSCESPPASPERAPRSVYCSRYAPMMRRTPTPSLVARRCV
jgi:hypothetical protein